MCKLDGKRGWFAIICALFLTAQNFACLGMSVCAQSAQ
jgi:uncharacterized membrane protein